MLLLRNYYICSVMRFPVDITDC